MHKRVPHDPQSTLIPGQGEDSQEHVAKPVEFWMNVTRSDGQKIGLDVDFLDGPYLKVRSLKEGIFKDWNSTNAMKIEEGDFIVEINGVKGDSAKLIELLMKSKTLQALVQKAPAGLRRMAP